jgi:stage IV sporulation protein FB
MLRLGPLRLHWSILLGAALFTALTPRPLLLIGYAAVLLAHVAGHAFAVLGTRLSVSGVVVHALGGELTGAGEATPLRRSVIALSGVLAQLALLLAALAGRRYLPPDLADALVSRNAVVLLLNLVPVKPLDGALAWRLPSRLRASRRLRAPDLPVSREVQRDVADLLTKIRGSTKVR